MPGDRNATHGEALERLIRRAQRVDGAVALAAYGSTASRTWNTYSDLDLILWVEDEVQVNSVHFTFAGIPVDLNLKSLAVWRDGDLGWLPPDPLMAIWDPQGIVAATQAPPRQSRPADAEQYRYAHAHRLLKLQQVIGQDDEVADFLVAGATHWIAVSWCHARGQRFPGIDKLVVQWRRDDPEMIAWLLETVMNREGRLEHIRRASERALEPVGGLLRPDEVYITGLRNEPVTDTDRSRTLDQLVSVLGMPEPGV